MLAGAGYTFPYLYDAHQAVAQAYKAMCTPEFYVFDGKQQLAYHGRFDESRPKNDKPVTGIYASRCFIEPDMHILLRMLPRFPLSLLMSFHKFSLILIPQDISAKQVVAALAVWIQLTMGPHVTKGSQITSRNAFICQTQKSSSTRKA